MARIKEKENMVRFITERERDMAYVKWVVRNGKPNRYQGCICCAELACYEDCIGITDKRVSNMLDTKLLS